jgi:hypothetical protein
VTLALLELAHIGVPIVGGPGTVLGTVIELLVALAGPVPQELLAVTVKESVNPGGTLVIVILPEPLWLT